MAFPCQTICHLIGQRQVNKNHGKIRAHYVISIINNFELNNWCFFSHFPFFSLFLFFFSLLKIYNFADGRVGSPINLEAPKSKESAEFKTKIWFRPKIRLIKILQIQS